MGKRKLINGFTQGYNLPRKATYVLFFGDLVIVYFMVFPLSSLPFKIISLVGCTIFGILVFISTYICAKCDPSDSELIRFQEAKAEGRKFEASEKAVYCKMDHAYVNKGSKHCRMCRRCVEDFDHHCIWINNCVGKKNYKSFFSMIAFVAVYLLIFGLCCVVLTVQYASDELLKDNDIYLYGDSKGGILFGMIIVWIFGFFSIVFLILDCNLVFLHLYLMKKGITTYQYVQIVTKKKEDLEAMAEAKKFLQIQDERTCFDIVICLKKKKSGSGSTSSQPGSAPGPRSQAELAEKEKEKEREKERYLQQEKENEEKNQKMVPESNHQIAARSGVINELDPSGKLDEQIIIKSKRSGERDQSQQADQVANDIQQGDIISVVQFEGKHAIGFQDDNPTDIQLNIGNNAKQIELKPSESRDSVSGDENIKDNSNNNQMGIQQSVEINSARIRAKPVQSQESEDQIQQPEDPEPRIRNNIDRFQKFSPLQPSPSLERYKLSNRQPEPNLNLFSSIDLKQNNLINSGEDLPAIRQVLSPENQDYINKLEHDSSRKYITEQDDDLLQQQGPNMLVDRIDSQLSRNVSRKSTMKREAPFDTKETQV